MNEQFITTFKDFLKLKQEWTGKVDTTSPDYYLRDRVDELHRCARNLKKQDADVIRQAARNMEALYQGTIDIEGENLGWKDIRFDVERHSTILRLVTEITGLMQSFPTLKAFLKPKNLKLRIKRHAIAQLTTSLHEAWIKRNSFTLVTGSNNDGTPNPIRHPDWRYVVDMPSLTDIRNQCAHNYEVGLHDETFDPKIDLDYAPKKHYEWLTAWLPQFMEQFTLNLRKAVANVVPCIAYEIEHWEENFQARADVCEQTREDEHNKELENYVIGHRCLCSYTEEWPGDCECWDVEHITALIAEWEAQRGSWEKVKIQVVNSKLWIRTQIMRLRRSS